MLNQDLVTAVARENDISQAKAKEIIASVFSAIAKGADGDPLQIHGFGSFRVVERKARKAKNPQTGEDMMIPAKKVLKYTQSKTLFVK